MSASPKEYDVFISFRGEDIRTSFASHLYQALCHQNIKSYIDYNLKRGDEVGPALAQAIENSHISLVVFSENYASSKWCLDELLKILECREHHGQVVIPVFHKIDPSDVRKQKGGYEGAFAKYERELKNNKSLEDKVSQWKAALTVAANLSGWDSRTHRNDSQVIENIVNDVLQKLSLLKPSMLIQTRRWLMQQKIWRFVGFASAVVGLLCYALSSSFNHLFGKWNFLKIFIYGVFSFIISLTILYANKWQHSRSLRFKAHTAFLVLTITSIYSFFFDKAMKRKPDAYSLISCASFAIMSLSLSRQNQCGFEVDLLYFFLGCLIVLLMKIKLQLVVVGVGFSHCLIILRSSFSSIEAAAEIGHTGLQDQNSVVIEVNSIQLAASINDV